VIAYHVVSTSMIANVIPTSHPMTGVMSAVSRAVRPPAGRESMPTVKQVCAAPAAAYGARGPSIAFVSMLMVTPPHVSLCPPWNWWIRWWDDQYPSGSTGPKP
jgi:hypothetical protein